LLKPSLRLPITTVDWPEPAIAIELEIIMSNIFGVSSVSSAANPYLTGLPTAIQANFGQTIQDFQAIGVALQSGNLTSAQTALAAIQKDFQTGTQSASITPFGTNTQANTDFQTLATSLKAGNLTGAQTAFASLQTDLQASLAGGLTSTGTSGSSFSNTLKSVLSSFGITF
jgi:hypothetical protein